MPLFDSSTSVHRIHPKTTYADPHRE